MSHYRDPLAGLRSQIATKRGLLETRERELSPLLRAMLPEDLRERLGELRERIGAEPASLEELTDENAALDELVAAHDEARQLVPKLRDCPHEVRDPPRSKLQPPWALEEGDQLRYRLLLTRRLAEIAPEAWLVRWDDTTYLSRLAVAGAPIVLTSRLDAIPAQPATFRSTVRTSVPFSTPALEVRRERIFDGIGRTIGVVHDDKTGDEALDRAYIVDARPGAIALLAPDVRQRLLEIASFRPRLVVKRGVVELAWGTRYAGDAAPLMPDAALAVVLGVRAAIERG